VNPQLTTIVSELESATDRLRALYATLPYGAWNQRPAPGRWSPAECVAHLNLTSRAFLPLLAAGLREALARPGQPAAPYRRDAIGWLLWKVVAPSGGLRTSTVRAFVPTGQEPVPALLTEFERLQAEVIAGVRQADGLPIADVKIVSPFDERVKYNLYAALTLVPRHQHRHLLQAERAGQVSFPVGSPVTA
jgi:hypothetical protein